MAGAGRLGSGGNHWWGPPQVTPQALPSLHSQAAMGLSCEREATPPQANQAEGWRATFDFVSEVVPVPPAPRGPSLAPLICPTQASPSQHFVPHRP